MKILHKIPIAFASAAVVAAAWFATPERASAQPFTLAEQPLWTLSPGDRDYLNFRPDGVDTGGYSEHGLAYNPVTNHLYIGHLSADLGLQLAIVDAEDGEHVGFLSVAGIEGGVRVLRKIAVTEDGVIFAGNLVTDSAADPYRLYRWADESADPVEVWSGDPTGGEAGFIRRFGDNLSVRGTGASTQILIAPDFWQQVAEPHKVGLFETTDGENFTLTAITTDATTRFGLGTSFGPGDLFYGSRAGQPMREFNLSGTLVREFDGGSIASGISAIRVDVERDLLAGLNTNQLFLYDRGALTTGFNPPASTRTFPTNNANIEATGEVVFGDGVVFALHTNNGVVAYALVDESEPPPPVDPVEPGQLYWTNLDALRTAEADGSNPRTVVPNLSRPIGVAIDADNGHVYWAEDQAGRIARANLDGTEVTSLVDGLSNPQGLAIDVPNNRMFWVGFFTGLYSAALDGSDSVLLVDMPTQQTTTVSYDPEGDWVYFGSALGTHYRVRPDGSGQETVAFYSSNTYGVYLDAANDRIFTTNFSGNLVSRVDLPFGSEENLISSGLHEPLHVVLSHDGETLYWVERATGQASGGRVRSAPLSDPTSFITLTDGENGPFGIVVMPPVEVTGFDAWIANWPEIPEGSRGPSDDASGDGISNLLNFALDLDPTASNRGALPVAETMEVNGETRVMLAISKNPDAAGATLVVEVSEDLVDWNSDDVVVIEETADTLVVRDNLLNTEGEKRFIRLRVELD